MRFVTLIPPLLALSLSPLLVGVINRTKANFAGRNGPPLAQIYYDIRKLLAKGAVYSEVTTWLFRAGPIVSLASFCSPRWRREPQRTTIPMHFRLVSMTCGSSSSLQSGADLQASKHSRRACRAISTACARSSRSPLPRASTPWWWHR